jgi:predicted membrane channel-forming protein YqfA (hemolysin III family)
MTRPPENLFFVFFTKENEMKLTPPKAVTFWISVALAALGLLSQLALFTLTPVPAFWLLFFGFVLLALSLMVKGL